MKTKITSAGCWLLVMIFASVFIGSTRVVAEEHEGGTNLPIDIATDFTYSSLYYWRGVDAGSGTSSFAQPSVDVSYTIGSGSTAVTIGGNVWYSQGLELQADEKIEDNNSEIDYTAYVNVSAGPVDISAGIIDYAIPNGAPFADGHVLEGNIGFGINALPFDNSVTAYLNLDGDDDNSAFIAPSVGYTYKSWSLGMTLGIALGESGYYGTDSTQLIDVTPSVSYSVGDETSISFNIGYNPDTNLKMPYFTIGTGF